MRQTFLPFAQPSLTEEDIAAVCDVLRSRWITTGARAHAFETRFQEYVGAQGAVAVASGTGGMHVLLRALGIGPGDEVVTPSMTWVSTVNLIVLLGARPVFADVDRDTLMVTAATLEPCLTARTRLIVPVHFGGAPLDLDPIRRLAAGARIPVIEDAAHAMGTRYRGELVGRAGTCVFSFHPIKNMTTGEGGMVSSDDGALLERVRRLKFHGLGVDAFDRQVQGRSPQAEVLEPGFKYNLTDMAAALGLSQLARLEAMNDRRRALAALYLERLSEIDEIRPLALPAYPAVHGWHLMVVRLDMDKARMGRDEFMARLKTHNIGTGLHFRAVHLQPFYREQMGFRRGLLPHTEWNSDRICSLPLFPDMVPEDVTDVIDGIKDVLTR